jgi:lambda family phage portal protein
MSKRSRQHKADSRAAVATVVAPRIIERVVYREPRAKFDAAQQYGDNVNHWLNADDLGPNGMASPSVREILRKRARYECANNCYARGILDSLAICTVGTGPRLQLLTSNEQLNERVEKDFSAWAKTIDLGGKLRLVRMSKAECGEIFIRMYSNPMHNHPVMLDLQMIEPDLIRSEFMGYSGKENEVDGIFFDNFGNRVKYRMVKRPINDTAPQAWEEEVSIPAQNMIHYFNAIRPGQVRGIPEIVSALPLFAQLRRFTLAVLGAAELQASMTGAYTPEILVDEEGLTSLAAFEQFSFERGMINVTPPGGKLTWPNITQPGATYEMFKNAIIEEMARCVNMPVGVAKGNFSGYNFASGRLDLVTTFGRAISVERNSIELNIIDKILNEWLKEYGLINNIRDMRNGSVPHQWFWDGTDHVDPSKEANAQETKLKNKLTTLQAEYAKYGKDWRGEIIQSIAEEELIYNERKKRGLPDITAEGKPAPVPSEYNNADDEQGENSDAESQAN